MDATVYVVRHGQTPWTAAERVQGWAPVPLTETGVEQMRAAARDLSSRLGADRPSRILSSDLRRTRESADVIADAFDPPVVVETDAAWRERDFGIYQGLSDERYEALYKAEAGSPASEVLRTPENGESWRAVESRVLSAWDATKASLAPGETVVLVSHYGPIHCLLASVAGRRLEEEMQIGYGEAGISTIAIEDGRERLVERDGSPLE